MKRFAGFAALGIVFEISARSGGSPMLVPISEILKAFARMLASGELVEHALASLERVSIGFLIAGVTGIGLGLLIYRYKTIDMIFMPIVDTMRPVAALTIFPIIILTMGLGLASKVFVIFWTAYPACLLNTVQGLRAVNKEPIEAATLDGASPFQVMRYVTVPLALPTIITGLRIGLSGGWISLVAAEMLGANSGLGFAVLTYSNAFRFPEMYASIVTIALLGLAMNIALANIQKHSDLEETHHEENRLLSFNDRAAGWITAFGLFHQ